MSLNTQSIQPAPPTDAQREKNRLHTISIIYPNLQKVSADEIQRRTTLFENAINAVWDAKTYYGDPVAPADILATFGTNWVTAARVSTNEAAHLIALAPDVLSKTDSDAIIARVNAAIAKVGNVTPQPDGSGVLN